MANPNVKGVNGAQRIMELIMASTEMGAAWVSNPRNDKVTNREVIKHLAEGNRNAKETIKRDIRPNQEDIKKAAEIFVDQIAKKMRIAGKNDSAGNPVSREKAAKQGAVSAMRKSMKHTAKVMYNRVKRMKTNDGSKAHPVGQKYAQQRNRKYGVANSVVFVASSQLANALQKGKIEINFKRANMSRLLKAVNRAKL